MRIGIHTSTGGSLERAALKAAELGANTFQIFSSSPRMWRYAPLDPEQVKLLRKARERFDLYPLAIHASYLINLGSSDPKLHAMSVDAFREELLRAADIGAEYLVVHPGNYKGCASAEEGIVAVVRGIVAAVHGIKRKRVEILVENTVGAGCSIGGRFEEIAAIRHYAAQASDIPVNFCIDTCHCLASGYDVASEAGLKETVKAMEKVLGMDSIRVIHTNDSKTGLNSHVDRHANIGGGHIGLDGFRRILNHPKLKKKPFILETPVDEEGDDLRNLEALKGLVQALGAKRITR